MTEPMVLSGVVKWCWSRLQGGIVGWDAYELFKIGEQGAHEMLLPGVPGPLAVLSHTNRTPCNRQTRVAHTAPSKPLFP